MHQLTSLATLSLDQMRSVGLATAVPIIAVISLTVHVLVGNNYGYFRDELCAMAMSRHSTFGYVDVPSLVPWITQISPLPHWQCAVAPGTPRGGAGSSRTRPCL